MDHAALYQKKLTSAADAVKVIKSGDWVDYGWCTNHPYTLDKALAPRAWAILSPCATANCRASTATVM